MAILIVLAYLVIGVICMGIFPDTAGRPFGGMIVLWVVIVPLLGLVWLFNFLYEFGEKLSKKIKR